MSPEGEIARALLARTHALVIGLGEALDLMGALPADADAMATMGALERTASTALLKRVEQLEDVLMRLFRTLLRADGVDTSELYNRDIANRMEKRGLVDDAEAWMTIVRLRNRLAHEYPVGRDEQFDRLAEACRAAGVLRQTATAVIRHLETRPIA